ncbi:MAG TPA: hypothetical protein VGY96_03635 [Streptosporangiaceae bacterium]|jgi:hypothetical protein|nr:hypothetical protein [Streptosporangiaceae bacterium]
MDGSAASLIAIPIVVVLSLAAWLILVAYAASHPQWKHGSPAAGQPNPGPAAPADDQPLSSVPRESDRVLAGSGALADQPAQRAA